eukprot:189428_1
MLPRTTRKILCSRQYTKNVPLVSFNHRSQTNLMDSNKQPRKSPTLSSQNTNIGERWLSVFATPLNENNSNIMQRVWKKRQEKLFKATSNVLNTFKNKNLTFSNVEIYIRKAGSFDDSENNKQKEVHIALHGIAHT